MAMDLVKGGQDEIDRKLGKINSDLEELKTDVNTLIKTEVEKINFIQLRMENRLIDNDKILFDAHDDHSKKLKNHEKRIKRLEETGV